MSFTLVRGRGTALLAFKNKSFCWISNQHFNLLFQYHVAECATQHRDSCFLFILWSYWVFCANSYWSVALAPRLLNVIQLNVFNACLLSNHLICRCTYWVFQSFKCTALCKCILQIQLNTTCHSLLLITAQVTYTWQISMIFICI